jgi:Phr family secreted Rap phosphatase inhibitor
MKRLLLGLAVASALSFGVSVTGSAQSWPGAREMRCPRESKPYCGYGQHVSCTEAGWACLENAERERSSNVDPYSGMPDRNSCLAQAQPLACSYGTLPRCHDGHWRCS